CSVREVGATSGGGVGGRSRQSTVNSRQSQSPPASGVGSPVVTLPDPEHSSEPSTPHPSTPELSTVDCRLSTPNTADRCAYLANAALGGVVGERQQPGRRRREAASVEVERTELIDEIDVEVLASGAAGLACREGDET